MVSKNYRRTSLSKQTPAYAILAAFAVLIVAGGIIFSSSNFRITGMFDPPTFTINTPPYVSSTLPTTNSTGASFPVSYVSIYFSEAMDTTTDSAVTGNITFTKTWLSLNTRLLLTITGTESYSTSYLFSVGTGIKDTGGANLQAQYDFYYRIEDNPNPTTSSTTTTTSGTTTSTSGTTTTTSGGTTTTTNGTTTTSGATTTTGGTTATTTTATTTTSPLTTANACPLPNAIGNYEAGLCKVVYCKLGYYNCDGNNVNGCESINQCPTTTTAPVIAATEQEAFAAIQDANNTIIAAEGKKNTTDALSFYSQAINSYNNGSYADAKSLALQSKSAIKEYTQPSQEIPMTYVLIALLVVIIIGGVVFYLTQIKKKSQPAAEPEGEPTASPQ